VATGLLLHAGPAMSQTADTAAESAPAVDFMPRTAFHMSADHLSSDDPRFVWDADFGGEFDIVDYRTGRVTFEGNYEVVLGEEIRAFDPNQGNYILTTLASIRLGPVEVAGELYHQSRHLADRAKQDPIDWNMLGGRVRRGFDRGQTHVEARGDLRGVFMKSFVDYSWELDAGVRADVTVHPRVGLLAAGDIRYLGVDGSLDRGNQTGYRFEGGVRFGGPGGAIELVMAAERRIDPTPLEVGTASWFTIGFRLLGQASGR
jgi:hypothetical protein